MKQPSKPGLIKRLQTLVRGGGGADKTNEEALQQTFRGKYNAFLKLLESNSALLEIITDIEVKLQGRDVFGSAYIRSQSSRCIFHALRMMRSFESLSGKSIPALHERLGIIRRQVGSLVDREKSAETAPFIMKYERVGRGDEAAAGGKNAHLGEIRRRLGLSTPQGFIITSAAFRRFFDEEDLWDEINKQMMNPDTDDPESLQKISEDIQRLILSAPLPESVAEAVVQAHRTLAENEGVSPDELRIAMRSSAFGEDSELSYAGQYLTVLNVPPRNLLETYKKIVASLYTPRALAYRLLKGISDNDVAMSVGCLVMIRSQCSGVMYTRHPFDKEDDRIHIHAVFGLGPYAVDGVVTPDEYIVNKAEFAVDSIKIAEKHVMLGADDEGGLSERAVSPGMTGRPCLSEDLIRRLADAGLRLEAHFNRPQDVEWALDEQRNLYILQSRPLADARIRGDAEPADLPLPDGHPLLLENGAVACPGVGAGPVRIVRDEADLRDFPKGAVLVAAHSSPKFMIVMNRAAAIVTDYGSCTGHMASLSREFGAPTVLGLKTATEVLSNDMDVTVDANTGRIYSGIVAELTESRTADAPVMAGTPVHKLLKTLAECIVPLHLIDPKAENFTQENCSTIHDIMRLLHEWSYTEMFNISDLTAGRIGMAGRVIAPTGLDLYVIDLGGGLAAGTEKNRSLLPDQVTSRPFRALLSGLEMDDDQLQTPRPLYLKGFFSVMSEQMLGQPAASMERFGDKSYAIISDKYCNFSSRVGYHYGVIDCYCGKTVNKNYITFSFKGGAADPAKRERRAKSIAAILAKMGFQVETTGDRAVGRFDKFEQNVIEDTMRRMGRLLQFTRQADMLMSDDQSIDAMVDSFYNGSSYFEYTVPESKGV